MDEEEDFEYPGFPYKKIKELGRGGYATVYHARHIKTNQERAIKIVKLPQQSKQDPITNSKREVEINSRLKAETPHPHLVKMYSFEYLGKGELAMVLEYCDQGDLGRYLRQRGGALGQEEARKLFQDLVLGLRHLYQNSIVHRDLKPQNLMLKMKGTELILKLGDFGFSKELESGAEMMATQLGTLFYIAPEIFTGNYDSKSDIWSAGAILYEMVTGKKVRSTVNRNDKGRIMQEGDFVIPPDARTILGHFYNPHDLIDLLTRMLRRYPDQRISWEEFFAHPWIDLRSRIDVDIPSDYWSGPDSPYQIGKEIGKGQTAVVYKATEKATKKTVAIKDLDIKNLRTQTRYADSEIFIMEQLRQYRHSSIVRLYRVHRIGDHILFVLEFCDKGNLQDYLNKNGPLEEKQAQELMSDLAKGLAFLKSKNIVHRDLKPLNFLLKTKKTGRLALKVADFGFAIQLEDFNQQMKSFVGTPSHVAPEKNFSGSEHSASSDLWSTGITMYQMLFGGFPFPAKTPQEVFHYTRNTDLDLDSKKGEVSPLCLDLVKKLLQRDPKKRITYDDFFAHPWLDLDPKSVCNPKDPAPDNEIPDRIRKVTTLKALAKRCPDQRSSFSLYMESLFILEQLLPPVGGNNDEEESSEMAETSFLPASPGTALRQPKTNPFKSDPSSNTFGSHLSSYKSSSSPPNPSRFLQSYASSPASIPLLSPSASPSNSQEQELRKHFEESYSKAARLAKQIRSGFQDQKIPSPLKVIYHQALAIGRDTALNESLGGDPQVAVEEYSFCISLLEMLVVQVGEEDQKSIGELIARFNGMLSAAQKKINLS